MKGKARISRQALDKMIEELANQHQALMQALYDAILAENEMPPWEQLDGESQAEVGEEAIEYCQAIAADPRTWWAAQVEPLDDVARLVAEQYEVGKRLQEAEAEKIATYRPTRH